MALLLMEGFDHLAFSQITTKGWTSSALNGSMVTGRFGGQAFQLHNVAGAPVLQKVFGSATTVYVGFAWTVGTTTSNLAIRAGSTNTCIVAISGTAIEIKNSSGTVIATGTAAVTTGFHYIEVGLVINGASGSVEVHVDGVVDIASTTGNFGTSAVTNIALSAAQNGTTTFDDIYVCDNTGSANNTFLGDVRVETLAPISDGAHTQWTPSSGMTHYTQVDDAQPDGDTSYVYDVNVGDRDSYGMADLATLSGSVFGVQTNLYARKDNTGTRQICAVARPTTTDYDGGTVTLGTSYATFSEIREQNPDTSAAWTIPQVNASEFGVKVVT